MRITGKVFKAFYSTAWPEGYIWGSESTYYPDNGDGSPVEIYDEKAQADSEGNLPFIISDDEVFTVPEEWYIEDENSRRPDIPLRQALRKFIKQQASATFLVSVPKEKEAELKAFLKSIKGKVEK